MITLREAGEFLLQIDADNNGLVVDHFFRGMSQFCIARFIAGVDLPQFKGQGTGTVICFPDNKAFGGPSPYSTSDLDVMAEILGVKETAAALTGVSPKSATIVLVSDLINFGAFARIHSYQKRMGWI